MTVINNLGVDHDQPDCNLFGRLPMALGISGRLTVAPPPPKVSGEEPEDCENEEEGGGDDPQEQEEEEEEGEEEVSSDSVVDSDKYSYNKEVHVCVPWVNICRFKGLQARSYGRCSTV